MKKGDLRKQAYLQAAETLFCRKGYEATSIQDILESLNASKGSFYHHFVSKESLLEYICRQRAEQIFQTASSAMEQQYSAISRLNALLSGMIPFREEKLSFLLMLLPVFSLPEGRVIKQCYCETLSDLFLDTVARCLEDGMSSGVLTSLAPDLDADILLTLVNHLWVRICEIILSSEKKGIEPDITECLRFTDRCRSTAERMLSLPYSSLDLIDIPLLRSMCEQIHAHWARL